MFFVNKSTKQIKLTFDDQAPEGADWVEAVEVRPEIKAHEQVYADPAFDFEKTPCEIIFNVIDIPISDRRDGMCSVLNYQMGLNEKNNIEDLEKINSAIALRIDGYVAAKTHAEMNLLVDE